MIKKLCRARFYLTGLRTCNKYIYSRCIFQIYRGVVCTKKDFTHSTKNEGCCLIYNNFFIVWKMLTAVKSVALFYKLGTYFPSLTLTYTNIIMFHCIIIDIFVSFICTCNSRCLRFRIHSKLGWNTFLILTSTSSSRRHSIKCSPTLST